MNVLSFSMRVITLIFIRTVILQHRDLAVLPKNINENELNDEGNHNLLLII